MSDSWDSDIKEDNCPLCLPIEVENENVFFVRKLLVSSLYLDKNQTYVGHSVLVYDLKHAVRLDQLKVEEWAAMAADLQTAEKAIFEAFEPDHINIASLGNVVPHLHWHIIPRYKQDPRWRDPIWMSNQNEMPVSKQSSQEYKALSEQINKKIDNAV